MTTTNNITRISNLELHWHQIENNVLTGIMSMDDATKAQVTDEQLDDYEIKYDEMKTYAREDKESLSKMVTEAKDLLKRIWGAGSKQVKYIERQTDYDFKNTTVSNHYEKFATPKFVRESVEIAKGKMFAQNSNSSTQTAISIDENNIQSIDKAIKYLTQEGYTYGTDFNTSNAVNIAKIHGMESVMNTIPNDECKSCEEDETIPDLRVSLNTVQEYAGRGNGQVQLNIGNTTIRQHCVTCGYTKIDYGVDFVEQDGVVKAKEILISE